jgi:hypothetical protein
LILLSLTQRKMKMIWWIRLMICEYCIECFDDIVFFLM